MLNSSTTEGTTELLLNKLLKISNPEIWPKGAIHSKRKTYYLILLLSFLFIPLSHHIASAQGVGKLEQAANGPVSAIDDPVDWVTGNVNANKAHFTECMTIPYRIEVSGLTPGLTYCLTIGWDTKKNGKNAIDYLTSYDNDNNHDLFGHDPEEIDPTDGYSALTGAPTDTEPIPAPSSLGASVPDQPTNAFLAQDEEDRLMTIFNGTIVSLSYDFEDDLSDATTSSALSICFQVLPGEDQVVLAWGGHIASAEVWGPNNSATNINGSPYHTFLESCNGCVCSAGSGNIQTGCGDKDVQLQAAAVEQPPTCDVDGPLIVCETETVMYTATTDDDYTYQWVFVNNNTGATFIGATDGLSVEVDPGDAQDMNSTFEVQIKITKDISGGTLTATCGQVVTVTESADAGGDGSASVCNDEGGPNPTTISLFAQLTGTPDAGGSWVDTDGSGVDITDPTMVDFTNITPGSYTFTYTVLGEDPCPDDESIVEVLVEECCDFFAECNLDPEMIAIEGCSTDDLPDPFTDPEDVFTGITDLPCGELVLIYEDGPDGNLCPDGIMVTRTYTLFDDLNGNQELDDDEDSETCPQKFLIRDMIPPVITCPDDITFNCQEGDAGTASATDACDPEPSISSSDEDDLDICGLGTITRTFTATDDCGNSSTCIQTITIQDITAPVITCPDDITFNCEEGDAGVATATDNCDDEPDVTSSDQTDLDNCGLGTITRTWTATDCAGNSSTCIQTITIQDITAPVITCPDDITFNCEEGDAGVATATDNCDDEPDVTSSDETLTGECGDGTITRTWTATDCAGNSSTCIQTITIQDITAPVITCPDDITFNCEEGDAGTATATDNCDDEPDVTSSDQTDLDNCGLGTITRTWTATDCAGNSSTCIQTITIQDITAPVITCPDDITFNCEIGDAGVATATDNCDQDPEITSSDQTDLDNCGLGTITRTWTATDCAGNSSTCIQTITIQDITAPVITCPNDITFNCEEGDAGVATATDNCDDEPDVTSSDQTDLDNCGLGTITRTWTATDCAGNSSTCIQTITIQDITAPVITCPDDITFNCEEGDAGVATATDNCDDEPDVTSSDQTDLDNCGLGTITRTWTATDCAGNSSTCIQTITIQDITAPVITCPDDVTFNCEEGDAGVATATDNCDDEPDVTSTDQTDLDNCGLGTITRTWTATDCAGNSSTCIQTITIQDITAPIITCPDDINFNCEEGDAGVATATDNCDQDPDVTSTDQTDLDNCGLGTITRTWTATDCAGNSSTCIQTITIQDITAPVITCPDDITFNCEIGDAGTATATDNCDDEPDVTSSDETLTGECGDGTITRTWTATDCAGNSSTCIQTITIQDITAPVITCPNDITFNCEIGDAGTATATDNCDDEPDVTSTDQTDLDNCGLGTITRTWTATDCAGNSSTCIQTITIQDITAPIITCPDDINFNCEEGDAGVATATDNCDQDPEITSSDQTDLDNCGLGTITRTWTATDCAGNSSTCIQTITFQDITAPIITCPDDINFNCEEGDAGVATATDNCDQDPEITSSDQTDLDNCGLGTITRTWTATDCAGNSSTCIQTITIQDITAPVITCPNDITFNCEIGDAGVATATDNCDQDPDVTSSDQTDLDNCGLGTITRTWTATDCAGNSSTCIQTITIQDITAPVITCPNDITFNCEEGDAGTATATDNCDQDPDVTSSDQTDLDNCGLGTITRTWTATDCAGNSSTCIQTITIQDITAPVITCPDDVTFDCVQGDSGEATATDNCDEEPVITFTDIDKLDDCGIGYISRNWKATDCAGNSSTCVQIITMQDLVPPVITCPDDITFNCVAGDAGTATATDVCDDNPLITSSDVEDLDNCGLGTITRTWMATDCSDNSSTCIQTITIQDITAPVITCPDDITFNCEIGDAGTATATDNCDDEPDVTSTDQTDLDICGLGTITRTWTATDCAGNSSTCIQTITIQDITAPVITCPDDITFNCEIGDAGTATATDNCDDEPDVTSSDQTDLDNCGLGTITRTWTATDCAGNSSTCIQTITIQDITAPVITCPDDITFNCEEGDAGVATATDNCDDEPDVTSTDQTDLDNCGLGTITRTWTATDCAGNSSTCIQTITIQDITAPVITCPDDITFNCEEGDAGVATATDNCDDEPEITSSDETLTGECGDGTITRTWTATDCAGNSSTCIQTINIQDITAPVITCPQDMTFECEIGEASNATATDDCDQEPGLSFSDEEDLDDCGLGIITRTWTATDCAGNSSTCIQTVTIQDELPPDGECPAGDDDLVCAQQIPCADEVLAEVEEAYMDNCSNATVTQTDDTGFPECVDGEFSRTFSFEVCDDCGNCTTCEVTYSGTCQAFCTLTQGGWGNDGGQYPWNDEDGKAPTLDIITYLFNNYGDDDDDGDGELVIGDVDDGRSLTIFDPECILVLLPAGGPADVLPSNPEDAEADEDDCTPYAKKYHNKKGRIKNVLVGQTITLQLNIWYNEEVKGTDLGELELDGECFTFSTENLPDDIVTVQDLLDLANEYLSGQLDDPDGLAGALTEAISEINEYFDECEYDISDTDPCEIDDDNELIVNNPYDPIPESSLQEEVISLGELKLWPNPANDYLEVSFSTEVSERVVIQVISYSGKVVVTESFVTEEGINRRTLQTERYSSGIYWISIQLKDQILNERFIIMKD